MQDAAPVDFRQRLRRLKAKTQRIFEIQSTLSLHLLGQRFTIQQLVDDRPGALLQGQDLHDVSVPDTAERDFQAAFRAIGCRGK